MIRAHTYSVVMRDPASGQLGVGVQSHWFNVGGIVPWVRAGVGAVATQSIAEPLYGPRGLDLMATGLGADDAMGRLLKDDDQRDLRQLGFVDHQGKAAAHTGARCIAHASHVVGDGWTVQANIMRSDRVVAVMAETAVAMASDGDLADRMMLVLEAAERSGGDLRGSQSAAMVIAGDEPVPVVDLRVEDHPDPIGELRRLLDIHRAYGQMELGDRALAGNDESGAAAAYAAAASAVASAEASGAIEVRFWQAVTMASVGRVDEGRTAFEQAVESNPDLVELLQRLVPTGLVEATVADALLGADR